MVDSALSPTGATRMTSQSIILFLELNGVLYNQRTADQRSHETTVSSEARTLAEIAEPYADQLDIVITDLDALQSPLERFRKQLSGAMAEKVIDSVYLQELTNSAWSDYHSALATRYACIKLWLCRRRPQHKNGWLALDSCHELDCWPADERHHLICGPLSNPSIQLLLAETLRIQQRTASR